MKKIIILLLLSISISTFSKSLKENNEHIITGIITDSITNEQLAGVEILSNGKKTYSDLNGRFVITINKGGSFNASFSFISYKKIELDMYIKNDSHIRLNQIGKK